MKTQEINSVDMGTPALPPAEFVVPRFLPGDFDLAKAYQDVRSNVLRLYALAAKAGVVPSHTDAGKRLDTKNIALLEKAAKKAGHHRTLDVIHAFTWLQSATGAKGDAGYLMGVLSRCHTASADGLDEIDGDPIEPDMLNPVGE